VKPKKITLSLSALKRKIGSGLPGTKPTKVFWFFFSKNNIFLAVLFGLRAAAAQASTPVPDAMANQPDPREYITRADTNLMALGNQLRFGGINVSWLGLRSDSGRPDDARLPTDFEMGDALKTVQMMGAGYIRVTSLAATAGCPQCLMPSAGELNEDTLKHADHVLKLARDAGVKIIAPLAGDGACPAGGPIDPVRGTPCVFAHASGLPVSEFYANPQIRAAFASHITRLLNHINPETGLAWKDDPTILAWENCDLCGAGIDTKTLADWTEFVGRTIKRVDQRHLYENGAFAGRLATVDASMLALPSVDIVGDHIAPSPGSPPALFTDAQQAVNQAGRAYIIDAYDWTPSHWSTDADFDAFLAAIVKDRAVAAALVGDLGAHASGGGWLPETRPDQPTLYFPSAPTRQVSAAAMAPRTRAVRRFSYRMMDLPPISFAPAAAPTIIAVEHGRVTWQAGTGAATYSIARTSDLITTGSWDTVCDQCATDTNPSWQDPSPPRGPVWYRITPYNANAHAGVPSEPVKNK